MHCLRKLASSSITGVGLSVCVAKQSACLQYVTFKFKLVRKYFMVFFKYFLSFFVHYFACLDCLLCYRYRFVIVNALTRTAVHTNKHHPPKRSNRWIHYYFRLSWCVKFVFIYCLQKDLPLIYLEIVSQSLAARRRRRGRHSPSLHWLARWLRPRLSCCSRYWVPICRSSSLP